MRVVTKKEGKALFKRIRQRKRKKRMPFSIMYELTYHCNFRCPHCYLGEQRGIKKEELNTGKVKNMLDELADIGVYNIGFTGGEPLVRKDIFEILDYANRCGFKFGLLTNGSLIDEKIADRLREVNVNKVDITFNAITPEVFDKISGIRGSFDKVKNAVEILRKKNIQVAIKSTCISLNKDELFKISQYARALNIPYRIDGEVEPCRNGCSEWVNKFSLDFKEIDEIRRKIYPEMFRGNGKRVKAKSRRRRGRMFNCGVGMVSFSVNPYGKMNFCLEIDYPRYDILSEGVKACWEKIKEEVDRLNSTKNFVCKDCDLLKYCGWCPGRSYLETGGFNKCSEYFRKRAIERRSNEAIT